MADLHAGKFWFVEEGPWYGYSDGTYVPNILGNDTPLCWAVPLFTRPNADQIVEWWNDHEGFYAWYEASEDAYAFGDSFSDRIEIYRGVVHLAEGMLTRLYAIGTATEVGRGGWCWIEDGVKSPARIADDEDDCKWVLLNKIAKF